MLKRVNVVVFDFDGVMTDDCVIVDQNGIESVRKNAQVAGIEDQTVEGFEKVKHPKFEVYADKKGEFRFRLKATNGEIIATSEGYKSKPSCLNGIESVKKNVVDAPVTEA